MNFHVPKGKNYLLRNAPKGTLGLDDPQRRVGRVGQRAIEGLRRGARTGLHDFRQLFGSLLGRIDKDPLDVNHPVYRYPLGTAVPSGK